MEKCQHLAEDDRRFRREDIVGILKLRETLKNFPHLGMED